MVKVTQPTTPDELREALREAASAGSRILLGGGFTKDAMGGAVADAGTRISTAGLKRVLAYEPNDLTVSVEAGLPYAELTAMLGREKQMIPLDPPLGEVSTVGGVVAANVSGSRRRLYGTARDLVIGMSYCTLEGDVAETGALVVKSVAGYDIHKLLIGSFGTLAAIASVNFKVTPAPEVTRTFVFSYGAAEQAMEMRGRIAGSVLQPAAVDYLNPEAAFRAGLKGHLILVRAAGTERLLARYAAELAGAEVYEGTREAAVWEAIGRMAPRWIKEDGGLAVVKLAHGAKAIAEIEAAADGPVWSQALNGVTRVGCR
ncbi:MAG: FAD-binding protein, partial [Bryobacteraceae bacterium]|nr:FAD-binding protein [Bryobacteraceae bacterium]